MTTEQATNVALFAILALFVSLWCWAFFTSVKCYWCRRRFSVESVEIAGDIYYRCDHCGATWRE